MGVRWKRSTGDYVESHCGRWWITPIYGGCTRPERYELRFDNRVVGGGANQRECKADAERIRPHHEEDPVATTPQEQAKDMPAKTKKPRPHRPSAVVRPSPSRPESKEGGSPERLSFVQSDEWESRTSLGPNASQDIYSVSNCCYCFRKTKPDAQKLVMIRTHDGNWWLIVPTAPIRSDELDRFWLPVGPDCLQNHPEWRFALATERIP